MRTATPTEAGIERAAAALAAGRPNEALASLSALLPPGAVDSVTACRLWLLSAEALAGVGRQAEARGHLIHAWVPPGPLLALPSLRAHELRVRLMLGELPQLGGALANCLRELADDRASSRLLLGELARAHEAAGELAEALACWQDALALSDGLDVQAHLRLGRLEHLRGHHEAALAHLASASNSSPSEASLRLALLLEDNPAEGRAEKALRLGLRFLGEGLGQDARDWLARAAQLALEQGLPDVRRRALEEGARAAAAEGDYARARSLSRGLGDPEGLLSLLLAAACRRGDAAAAFEFGELQRFRRLAVPHDEAHLRDRARPSSPALPHLAGLFELQCSLAPGQVFAAPAVVGEEAWLLVCTPTSSTVSPLPRASGGRQPPGVAPLPLAAALWRATEGAGLLFWCPSAAMEDFPVAGLRHEGQSLVERSAVAHALSGSHVVYQARHPAPWHWGRVVIVDGPEAEGVAATFWFPTRLAGLDELPPYLSSARLVHLPAGELPAGDVAGLPLVVLGAGGREQARQLLARGVRSVLAPLWPMDNAAPLLWAFYRHRMACAPARALALAQRDMLHTSTESWAGLAFFGDPLSLPAAGLLWGLLARWGQGRHARLFPVPPPEPAHAV